MNVWIPAYLDAGRGSLLIQAMVAGLAEVAVFSRYPWSQLRGLFRSEDEADPKFSEV